MLTPAVLFWIVVAWLAMIGGAVGSFLNVVVYRLPLGISLVYPPSRCPKCGSHIAWYDNVPVFGWIMLRGRCRQCHDPISGRYPLIEGITALMFGAVAAVELPDFTPTQSYSLYPYHLLLLCTLLCAALIEYDGNRPPWRLFAPALVVGLAAPLFLPALRPMSPWFKLFGGGDCPICLACLIEGLTGLGVGAFLGFLMWRSLSRERPFGLAMGLPCAGLYLGWQAVSFIALGTLLLMALAWAIRKWLPQLNIPPGMIFGIVVLAWILCEGALQSL